MTIDDNERVDSPFAAASGSLRFPSLPGPHESPPNVSDNEVVCTPLELALEHLIEEGLDEVRPSKRLFSLAHTRCALLFPTLLDRNNGVLPVDVGRATGQAPPTWHVAGVPFAKLTPYNFGKNVQFGAIVVSPPPTCEHFSWGIGYMEEVTVFRAGTYAVVLCQAEDYFRALHTEPAALGEACGHAALASEKPVLFAGEICLDDDMNLKSWTAVSGTHNSFDCLMHITRHLLIPGTYQIPDSYAKQSNLPANKYWRFIQDYNSLGQGHDMRVKQLKGGHALVQDTSLRGTQAAVESQPLQQPTPTVPQHLLASPSSGQAMHASPTSARPTPVGTPQSPQVEATPDWGDAPATPIATPPTTNGPPQGIQIEASSIATIANPATPSAAPPVVVESQQSMQAEDSDPATPVAAATPATGIGLPDGTGSSVAHPQPGPSIQLACGVDLLHQLNSMHDGGVGILAPLAQPHAVPQRPLLKSLPEKVAGMSEQINLYVGVDQLSVPYMQVATLALYLCEENITGYAPSNKHILTMLMAIDGGQWRVHKKQAFQYDPTGAWLRRERLVVDAWDMLTALEGLFIKLGNDNDVLGWNWAAVGPEVRKILDNLDINLGLHALAVLARESSDHVRKQTKNKIWNANWTHRVADMVARVRNSLDRSGASSDNIMKLFLKEWETPMPRGIGVAFLDVYVGEDWEEKPKHPNNNCYTSLDYTYHITQELLEQCQMNDLDDARQLLRTFMAAQYFEGGERLSLKAMFLRCAFGRVSTGRQVFLVGGWS